MSHMVDEKINDGAEPLSVEAISDAVTHYAVTMCKAAGTPLSTDAVENMKGERTTNKQAFDDRLAEINQLGITKNQLVDLMNTATTADVNTLFSKIPQLKELMTDRCSSQNERGARSHV